MARLAAHRLAASLAVISLLFLGAGCWGCQDAPETTAKPTPASPYQGPDVLSFSLNRLPIELQRYEAPANRLFPVGQLVQNARGCGSNQTQDYFSKLARRFIGTQAVVYSFKYVEPTADNGVFTLIAVPNLPGYRDLDAFRADFDSCVAGGRYSQMLNDKWLLFADGCPNVGNWNLPAGCQIMRDSILKSVKFKGGN